MTDKEQLSNWQLSQIKKGLEEADRGEFASAFEVERVLAKWTGKRVKKFEKPPLTCGKPVELNIREQKREWLLSIPLDTSRRFQLS